MEDILIYPAGSGNAVSFAVQILKAEGIRTVDHPTPEITHLLLDVPTKDSPEELLKRLPESVTVIGGNLNQPCLEGRRKLDLLKEEAYVCRNASITAHCALSLAARELALTFQDAPALVIGWGRIGKCLGHMLKALDCPVTIGARKEDDRAMASALGFDVMDLGQLPRNFRLIFNTAPDPVYGEAQLQGCPCCLKIDLASRQGLGGTDVLWARGLPGRLAPESSGRLIARTILKHLREETT